MSSTSSVEASPKVESSSTWWRNPYVNEGYKLWPDSKYKDFQIIIGDRVLDVHKCVLAARSPVFAAMLSSGLTEAQSGQLNIQDFDFETVEKAINYCYCDRLFFIGGSVISLWDVLTFGHKYDIQHLVRACLRKIKTWRNEFDNFERTFIVKSAFALGCNEVIDPILEMFVKIKGELVANSPYPALGTVLLVQDESFKDLKIICDEDGTEFSVHKFILGLRSPVFEEIFEYMVENGDTSGRLTINKFKSAAVQKAVEFLYIGYIADEAFEKDPHLLLGLLEFADRFKVEELASLCLAEEN